MKSDAFQKADENVVVEKREKKYKVFRNQQAEGCVSLLIHTYIYIYYFSGLVSHVALPFFFFTPQREISNLNSSFIITSLRVENSFPFFLFRFILV